MSLVKIPDGGGDTITLLEYEGHYLPNAPVDVIKNMRDVTIRDDDVFICAYPKCGTHWVFEIARLLLAGSTDIREMEKDALMLEFVSNDELEQFPSPRLLNCHLLPEQLPKGVFETKTKFILLHRNPKDVAVSFYHHTKNVPKYYQYTGKWENYLDLFIEGRVDYGAYHKYLKYWADIEETHPDNPVLRLAYEDIKAHPLESIKRLAVFLGVERSEEFYCEVEEKTSFTAMKTSRPDKIAYRKGQVGDWQNYFTVAQNEHFERICEKENSDTNMKFQYTIETDGRT